jgi:hypothetical protein
MSANPDFVSQSDTNYTPVRFYTAFDPYFYTVDNRPLQDLEANIKAARTGGGDAARRANILGSLDLSAILSDLYTAPSHSTKTRVASGLKISSPSANVLRVGPGAVYELREVSTTITDVITKIAIMVKNTDFNFNAPSVIGQSIVYTIEGKFVELTASTMVNSRLPVIDSKNTYLPSTLLNGELVLNLIAGVSAVTANAVPAVTTLNNFPIYNVTYTYGASNPTITVHANSPYLKGMFNRSTPLALTTNGAASVTVNDMVTNRFPDAAISGVSLPVPRSINNEINPYVPLRVRLTISSSVASGNVALRLRYKGFQLGESISAALTTGITESLPITVAVDTFQDLTTSTAIIPNTEFAGFVNGQWVLNKERLHICLDRLGSDVLDTNTGAMSLFNVVLFQ